METAQKLASYLLQSKSIIIDPANPFTWASGWRSPIYCDNRRTLSYPEIRRFIRDAFIGRIKTVFDAVDMIAGVATGAIAQGALVAEELDLPFVYVRSSQKVHGTGNLVEGDPTRGKRVVIVEDLVSTGGSSLKAVQAIVDEGLEVLGLVAVFSYGFPLAIENFRKAGIRLETLGDYETLISEAVLTGLIGNADLEILSGWRHDPGNWKPAE